MSNRYAAIPIIRAEHPACDEMNNEMQAAFDYSEDDDDLDDSNEAESAPLNPEHTSPASPSQHLPSPGVAAPDTYDFENVEYDRPPPGSPPRPSAVALPNEHGNTNGFIPNFNSVPSSSLQQNWIQRTAARVIPPAFAGRLGLHHARPAGVIGGGVQNDGVFANVTAKPSVPVRIQEGDETFMIPEEARDEAPPSYAAAQADAVPPYWDTTVHAPFAPDAMGEMIIDSLPTGSVFSFLWNMLVSISFQFVGFLLTYILHTTHAARFGSRAGLGVTLIQYGFALRSRLDNEGETAAWGTWKAQQPTPSDSVGDNTYDTSYNSTTPYSGVATGQSTSIFAEATTEWLSFFLMTVGWFILLTSALSFWRIKRWERGITSSQRETPVPAISTPRDSSQENRSLGLLPLSSIFQHLGRRTRTDDEPASALTRAEEGLANHHDDANETDAMLSGTTDGNGTPVGGRRIARALEAERRLTENLRAAGFL